MKEEDFYTSLLYDAVKDLHCRSVTKTSERALAPRITEAKARLDNRGGKVSASPFTQEDEVGREPAYFRQRIWRVKEFGKES